jgi:hypothetical protein
MGLAANPAVYLPGATLGNVDDRRILQPFGNINKISSQGNASYHGVQAEVNKRFSRGLSLQAAYTFSRSIDMASGAALGGSVPNVLDLRTQRGLSDFHAKHIGSVSWILDLPKLGTAPAIVRGALGGWQVNGLISARSGMPVNITLGSDRALSGTPNQRPDVTGDPTLPSDRSKDEQILAWFNRNVFAMPALGSYGNVGRNAVLGPGYSAANLGLFKNFVLPGREGLRLQFRSEFFNVLNNVNLGSPTANLSAGTRMGRITSAGDARVIQFALKVLY